ncbi:hypothetical protein RCCS2_04634 [Roseobacter sp. CCS2]|nr:hypothetical protein RCCS2_04634 [Roseobacter sp. CCS2]
MAEGGNIEDRIGGPTSGLWQCDAIRPMTIATSDVRRTGKLWTGRPLEHDANRKIRQHAMLRYDVHKTPPEFPRLRKTMIS